MNFRICNRQRYSRWMCGYNFFLVSALKGTQCATQWKSTSVINFYHSIYTSHSFHQLFAFVSSFDRLLLLFRIGKLNVLYLCHSRFTVYLILFFYQTSFVSHTFLECHLFRTVFFRLFRFHNILCTKCS